MVSSLLLVVGWQSSSVAEMAAYLKSLGDRPTYASARARLPNGVRLGPVKAQYGERSGAVAHFTGRWQGGLWFRVKEISTGLSDGTIPLRTGGYFVIPSRLRVTSGTPLDMVALKMPNVGRLDRAAAAAVVAKIVTVLGETTPDYSEAATDDGGSAPERVLAVWETPRHTTYFDSRPSGKTPAPLYRQYSR